MVDHLLQQRADPGIPDTKIGKLPEDWAEHGGHKELAESFAGSSRMTSAGVMSLRL